MCAFVYTLKTQTCIERDPSQVGVTVPRDFCWNSRLGPSCPSTNVSVSLRQRAGATVFSVHPSIPLPYGDNLKSDHEEEMGSGSVGAPPAPQGPPKQVAGEEIRWNEGNKALKGWWIDKANKQGSCFLTGKAGVCFVLTFYLMRCLSFLPLQDSC